METENSLSIKMTRAQFWERHATLRNIPNELDRRIASLDLHHEYHRQFLTKQGFAIAKQILEQHGMSEAEEFGPHLNEIPLREWDAYWPQGADWKRYTEAETGKAPKTLDNHNVVVLKNMGAGLCCLKTAAHDILLQNGFKIEWRDIKGFLDPVYIRVKV